MSVLVEFLSRNAEDKGTMAMLRCGLAEDTEMRAWPILARFGGIGNNRRARAVRTVAGLFALHPKNCESGNMGTVCRNLCRDDEKPWNEESGSSPGPMGRRMLQLVNADADEIHERVRHVVRHAASRDIPVNYAQLEKDLERWPKAREAWASAFWAPAGNVCSGNETSGNTGEK